MWIYVYLAITASALILEFCTNDMVSIWFAGGGVVSMILAAVNLPWFVHIPVFIILSFVLLCCFRKIVIKYLDKGDNKINADAAIGKEYSLIVGIDFEVAGAIRVNGIVWTAVSKDRTEKIAEGTVVRVTGIEGNKYIVEKV
jgi:membrane protein implicated in regulation of membrane protease activity